MRIAALGDGIPDTPAWNTRARRLLRALALVVFTLAAWSTPHDARAQAPAVEAPAPDLTDAIARAEGIERDQAAYRDALEARRRTPPLDAERRTRIEALIAEAHQVESGSAEATALLKRVMDELGDLRPNMDAALDAAASPPPVPRAPEGVLPAGDASTGPEVERLKALHRSLADAADALEGDARQLARDRLVELLGVTDDLNDARVEVLGRLGETQRDDALGTDAQGMEQLRWELWHLGARARWYGQRRAGAVAEIRAALGDPFVLAALAVRGAVALGVLVAAIYLARRRQRMLDAALAALRRLTERGRVLRALDRVHAILSSLSGDLAFLATVWGVHWALGAAAGRARGVELGYALLLWYGLYRVTVTALHRVIAWRAAMPNAMPSEATNRKILNTLQWLGRYTLGVGVVLTLSEMAVGRGYLHNVVVRLAWLGAIPLAYFLIQRWRDDICKYYLLMRGEGPLADAVRRTRARWYGFFVAVVAFSALVLAALGRAARRFLLRFELTHRLLAFLFRRRLERHATTVVSADPVPEEVAERMPEEPLCDPTSELDHYPGLNRFEEQLATWRDHHRRIGSLLLVGGAGSGKTTWLEAAERKAAGLPIRRVALRRRLSKAEDLLATLAEALDAPADARGDTRALAAWIRAQPQRLVIIDDLEHLFLRGIDTWGAWDAFLEVVEYSAPGAFWLCALALYPHRYLTFARGDSKVFRETVKLGPWSEQELTDLIRARTKASLYQVRFDELVLDEEAHPDPAERELQAERDFMRLLWDYAQGCPRVALHFWLRSLALVGDETLSVRLFATPYEEALEELDELERFVLASVVWHDSLTTEEAAWSLDYPALPCEDALAKLLELGVIDDHGGRHRVTTHWQRAVTLYLLRKHLI